MEDVPTRAQRLSEFWGQGSPVEVAGAVCGVLAVLLVDTVLDTLQASDVVP
jgi:hypothetical protein